MDTKLCTGALETAHFRNRTGTPEPEDGVINPLQGASNLLKVVCGEHNIAPKRRPTCSERHSSHGPGCPGEVFAQQGEVCPDAGQQLCAAL